MDGKGERYCCYDHQHRPNKLRKLAGKGPSWRLWSSQLLCLDWKSVKGLILHPRLLTVDGDVHEGTAAGNTLNEVNGWHSVI